MLRWVESETVFSLLELRKPAYWRIPITQPRTPTKQNTTGEFEITLISLIGLGNEQNLKEADYNFSSFTEITFNFLKTLQPK